MISQNFPFLIDPAEHRINDIPDGFWFTGVAISPKTSDGLFDQRNFSGCDFMLPITYGFHTLTLHLRRRFGKD